MELATLHISSCNKKIIILKPLFIYKKTYICTRNPLE